MFIIFVYICLLLCHCQCVYVLELFLPYCFVRNFEISVAMQFYKFLTATANKNKLIDYLFPHRIYVAKLNVHTFCGYVAILSRIYY